MNQMKRIYKYSREENTRRISEYLKAYIKFPLSDEQALQFPAENNAKILWDKIKSTFTGQTEDRKIDAGNELKNLQINSNELANDYIARAR
ncbi:hypothetical protein AVEN_87503-1 [Araneus ventricosus]|uniref:Uncharacterized protein n=1 Tax=Araneus ventricosus TaxID=182803 RepID=A0A4Y2CI66_ARAVE|nr:hypothetical protein AVEN_87503-1 [Araneus ventricosus]